MKRLTALLLCALCLSVMLLPGMAEGNNLTDWQQETDVQLKKELGAFEITAHQRETAKTNEAGYPVLDAGRGNPNWINTQARYAFTRFSYFATHECELDMSSGSMAGHARQEGIGDRFDAAMDAEDPVDAFLIQSIDYCVTALGLDKNSLLKELADAVIGDYYPSPSRVLPNIEIILNAYLQSTLYHGTDLAAETQIFPTEGGTAAMVIYLRRSAITGF